jgi:rod shape-determining protein MreD
VIARLLATGLVLFTAVVLQTSLFPAVTFVGFRPDLLLLVVVAIALADGPLSALRVGVVAGLLTDLLVSQAPAGLAVLVYGVLGFTVGLARPYLAIQSLTAPLILAFLTGALGTAAYGTLALLLGDERVTLTLLVQAALTVGLYNTLLSPLVLAAVRRLSARFPLGTLAGD